jgi:hypothetical protein
MYEDNYELIEMLNAMSFTSQSEEAKTQKIYNFPDSANPYATYLWPPNIDPKIINAALQKKNPNPQPPPNTQSNTNPQPPPNTNPQPPPPKVTPNTETQALLDSFFKGVDWNGKDEYWNVAARLMAQFVAAKVEPVWEVQDRKLRDQFTVETTKKIVYQTQDELDDPEIYALGLDEETCKFYAGNGPHNMTIDGDSGLLSRSKINVDLKQKLNVSIAKDGSEVDSNEANSASYRSVYLKTTRDIKVGISSFNEGDMVAFAIFRNNTNVSGTIYNGTKATKGKLFGSYPIYKRDEKEPGSTKNRTTKVETKAEIEDALKTGMLLQFLGSKTHTKGIGGCLILISMIYFIVSAQQKKYFLIDCVSDGYYYYPNNSKRVLLNGPRKYLLNIYCGKLGFLFLGSTMTYTVTVGKDNKIKPGDDSVLMYNFRDSSIIAKNYISNFVCITLPNDDYMINEFKLYREAPTASEIRALYNRVALPL